MNDTCYGHRQCRGRHKLPGDRDTAYCDIRSCLSMQKKSQKLPLQRLRTVATFKKGMTVVKATSAECLVLDG
jgi:hypothetical protein